MGDIVAKRFLASERETLIQYRARASNVWITNPFPPIRLSRISILHFLRGDFCNNIGTCETSTDVRYTAASKGNPDIEPTLAKTGFDPTDTWAAQDFRSAKALFVPSLKRDIVPSIACIRPPAGGVAWQSTSDGENSYSPWAAQQRRGRSRRGRSSQQCR
jgi:hypothetical protein